MNILDVRDLKIWDIRNDEVLVDGLSFSVRKGTCLALVGESGSGKSMTVKSVNRIHAPWIITEGEIRYNGTDLLLLSEKKMREIRGKSIFVIFQDAMSSFDPSMRIGKYVTEIITSILGADPGTAHDIMQKSMKKVMLSNPEEILLKYPHQLSGGMLQRMVIAMALTVKPELIIADEPTTGLDTITQFEVVEEMRRLLDECGNSMIFISHDLGVVKKLADDVVIMRNGRMVEKGAKEDVFLHPAYPYTAALVNTRKALGENYRRLMREE